MKKLKGPAYLQTCRPLVLTCTTYLKSRKGESCNLLTLKLKSILNVLEHSMPKDSPGVDGFGRLLGGSLLGSLCGTPRSPPSPCTVLLRSCRWGPSCSISFRSRSNVSSSTGGGPFCSDRSDILHWKTVQRSHALAWYVSMQDFEHMRLPLPSSNLVTPLLLPVHVTCHTN